MTLTKNSGATAASGVAAAAPHSEFRWGWRVLLAALFGVACGASPVPYNTIGFMNGPLHDEFGWSFRDIGLGITVQGVTSSLLAPFFGYLSDRYGVRPVALLSLAAFGLTFAALGFIPNSLPGYYALWFCVGLVGIGSTPVTWTRGVNLWFFTRRGLALGLVLVGTSLTAMLLPQFLRWSVHNMGWRMTFPLVALLPLLIALPIGLWGFREPRPEQRPPELASADGTLALAGLELPFVLRDFRFWILVVSIFCVATAYGGAFVSFFQILKLHRFAETDSAWLVTLGGLSILIGRVGAGYLLDRIWAPLVTLPLLSAPALACLWLAGDNLPMMLAIMSAILLGVAAGAETDLIAYLTGRYFGMAHYGKIYGLLYMVFGFGSAISPALYGAVRDATGNYDLALQVAAVMFVAGAVLLLLLGRYPDARHWAQRMAASRPAQPA